MTDVRNKGTYEQWILFFLQAILESAEDAIITIDELTALHETNIESIAKLGRASKNALKVFSYLESNPIIEIKKTSLELNLAFNTTASAINRLMDLGVLVQVNNSNRNRIFSYEAYLQILRKGT